ncbi:MAG: hypothetical protein O2954_13550 [bacterium]|nr:hypothetical protein [bacterium]
MADSPQNATRTPEQRLTLLERQVRLYRNLTAGLAIVLLGIVALGATTPGVSDVIRCKALEIVDVHGNIKIFAGTEEDGDGLFTLSGQNGKELLFLGAGRRGNGQFRMATREGEEYIYLGAGERENGLMVISTKEGRELVYAGAGEKGGLLMLKNKAGEDALQALSDTNGAGVISLYGPGGKTRIFRPAP